MKTKEKMNLTDITIQQLLNDTTSGMGITVANRWTVEGQDFAALKTTNQKELAARLRRVSGLTVVPQADGLHIRIWSGTRVPFKPEFSQPIETIEQQCARSCRPATETIQ